MIRSGPVLRTISVALALGCLVSTARANPAGVVPTAGHGSLGERIHIAADYAYEIDQADIDRERSGAPGTDPLGPLPLQPDLTFEQVRQLVTPKIDLALYHNLWVSFSAPIIIAQSRELHLAGGVARNASSTVVDGLLPANGFDARAPGAALAGDLMFVGVNRAGVPELRGGVGWAPMNQALDDTKPTWKLGIEGRYAITRVMQFDAANPSRENGVSNGLHELRVWTSVDRRLGYFEGWFETAFQTPIATTSDTLYKNPGFGASSIRPGPTVAAAFGVETYFVDNPATGTRFSLDLGARLTTHFEGHGYSEMWEVFALAGAPGKPLVLDADPTIAGSQDLPHPGVTTIEGYLETAGKVALRARLGRHVTLAALGEVVWKSDHVISFSDAGIDLPTCPTGAPSCEVDSNDLVSPGTVEVNPLHSRRIDLVGHRYHASDSRGIVLGAEVQILF